MTERSLNLNIPESIASFKSAMNYFEAKTKIYRLFRGKGLEFDRYRSFSPDDDAALIDWKASMRAQKILLKQYMEEKDLKIVFLIDVGDSMVFGSGNKLKCEYATELTLALGHLMIQTRDRVGFVLFSDRIVNYSQPIGGMKQFYYFNSVLTQPEIYGGASRLDIALDFTLGNFTDDKYIFIIVSDFINSGRTFEDKIKLVSSRSETIAIMIKDIRDFELPDDKGEVIIEDPSSGRQLIVNPRIAAKEYKHYAIQQEKKIFSVLQQCNIDSIKLMADTSFAFPLAQFFKRRISRI